MHQMLSSSTSPVPRDSIAILTGILQQRQKKNASYSKSALARDMGISQPLLSLIFGKRRPLTTVQAKRASILLKLSHEEEKELVESTLRSEGNARIRKQLDAQKLKADSNRMKELDFDQFSALAQWFHMPIIALISTKAFRRDYQWVARKIGISATEAKEAVERLIRLGMVTENAKGDLKLSQDRIDLTPKKSEVAIRAHHAQMMRLAEETMKTQTDEQSWMKRDISSLSLAVDSQKVPEAKLLIQKFREEMSALLTEGNISEVYQFNVQLFPITRSES